MTAPAGWRRTEITVGGICLSVLERESIWTPCGDPILILHGLVAAAETFTKVGDLLPPHRRIVAVDLPGSGFSERPRASDASFSGVAATIHEVIVALGMAKPVVLGHSYGGAIALRLAVSFPDTVRGLILLAPAHPFSHREDALVRFYLSPPGRLLAYLLPILPRGIYLFVFRRMPGSRAHVSYDEIQPYLQTLRTSGTIAYVLRMIRSWKTDMEELGKALERSPLAAKTLLLWGERDVVVPLSTAAQLMKHLPDATLIALPVVGHLPNEEAPEECARAITDWLDEREKSAVTRGR